MCSGGVGEEHRCRRVGYCGGFQTSEDERNHGGTFLALRFSLFVSYDEVFRGFRYPA